LVDPMLRAVSGRSTGWPELPVSGWTSRPRHELSDKIGSSVRIRQTEKATYFWGRFPLNRLVDFFTISYTKLANFEYAHLRTPLHADGSKSIYDKQFSNLLTLTADAPGTPGGIPPKVGAAIVDMGTDSPNPPDNYLGKLRHAVTTAGELSDH